MRFYLFVASKQVHMYGTKPGQYRAMPAVNSQNIIAMHELHDMDIAKVTHRGVHHAIILLCT